MIGTVKTIFRRSIAIHRLSAPIRLLHGVASFVEAAYSNEGSSFQSNGEQNLIRRLRAADFKIAFDVGANHGEWLLAALDHWPQCQIHAFEVAKPTFTQLERRLLASQSASRVMLNCCGLSQSDGVQQMYYFPEHPELTCDLQRHNDYTMVAFEAKLRAGDQYCEERHIGAIDFLKIDVEGAEFKVLKGFADRLRQGSIHCLQFEYGAFSTQTRFLLADYYALLSQQYWVGKIFPTYVDFKPYEWTMEDFRFANFCCVSKARPDLRDLLAAS